MDDLSGLRWLARTVMPDVVATSPELPAPLLVSTHLSLCRDYVYGWIANPDPSGIFARKTRWLRRLPSPVVLRILLAVGYDGFIYVAAAGGIMGHVFFQRRGTAIHAFSGGVSEGLGGHGYALMMVLDCVAYASCARGVVKARIGRGHNKINLRLLRLLEEHEASLGWRVTADGWVNFQGDSQNREREAGIRCAS